MNHITQSFKIVLLAVFLSFGISYAFAWVAPTVAPTGGNSVAPLNTSSNDQTKNGNIFLNALGITNTAPNALNVLGGGYFGGDVEVANGSGITLGGVKKTVWPSGSVADWNTMINKPAGFADGVDNVGGTLIQTRVSATSQGKAGQTATAQCPVGYNISGGDCNGGGSNNSTSFTSNSLSCYCYGGSVDNGSGCSVTAIAVCIKI